MKKIICWLIYNKFIFTFGILLSTTVFDAFAVVNTEKSRVIFNSDETVASLSLANSEKEPVIVQAWTDNGDPTVTPDIARTPIVIQPSVFKMKIREIRNVRLILASKNNLPKDRESLFWLNIYQIPPNTNKKDGAEQNIVLPLRIRLKVLIRPDGIGSLTEYDANKIKINILEGNKDKKINFYNPTPWHLSVASVTSGKFKLSHFMIEPFSEKIFDIPNGESIDENVVLKIINDEGFNWSIVNKIHKQLP